MTNISPMASRMINASICAYQIYDSGVPTTSQEPVKCTIQGPKDAFYYAVVPAYQDAVGFPPAATGYAPEFYADGDDRIDAALVGRTEDNYIVVSLRGTIPPSLKDNDLIEWIKDWAQDADLLPTAWTPNGENWGHAEAGFARATRDVWKWMEGRIEDLLQAEEPVGICVTGHSKGGAMTYLMASLIATRWPDHADKIQVHAFAAAVSGSAGFEKAYNAAGLGARTTRYQVEHDLVPFVPFWDQADVWKAIHFSGFLHEAEWRAFVDLIYHLTGDGYSAPGAFVYFNAAHQRVPDAVVTTSALPAVVQAMEAKEVSVIADAHSAVNSYLPCFRNPEDFKGA